MDNDQNFKNLILDYPYAALELFAPGEAINLRQGARIIPIREEQLKDRLGDRFRELDVPLLVEWPDGQRAAVVFVLEEETDPRRFSVHRLAHYCLDLSELFQTDRVIPIVVFLRSGPYRKELVLGSEQRIYLQFGFVPCALAELSYENYRESDNVVARLNLPNMRYASQQRVDVYAHAVRGLRELETDPDKISKYLDFIDIYADLDETEQKLYIHQYPQEAELMSTFAERFRQEGMQLGEVQILLRQLSHKFGELPPDVRRKIESADSERLLQWSERVLTARSLDEVLQ